MIRRLVDNIRNGRVQKLLAATTALSVPALGAEIYLEHYKGSFGDRWMWTPLLLTPPLTAAGVAGLVSEKTPATPAAVSGGVSTIGVHIHLSPNEPL